MGRPTNGVPYLKQGKYHVRFAGDKMSTDLGTSSDSVARRRLGEVLRARGVTAPTSRTSVATQPPKPSFKPPEANSVVQGQPSGASSAVSGPLDDWYNDESEFDGGVEPGRSAFDVGSTGSQTEVIPTKPADWLTPDAPEATKPGLSQADRDKMHSLLGGCVAQVNVLLLGMGCRIFGRIPAEPSKEDTELLEKAWQLQLTEWFQSTEVKPYVLILAASAGLGVSMCVQGEAKPKEVKVQNDGTQAK